MAFTFDLSTDTGVMRLLIPDRSATEYVFADAELAAFLTIEGDTRRAAALALETIASDHVLTLKVVRLLDLTTDGAKSGDALLKRAERLRSQADAADMAVDGGLFDIAEMVPNDFAWRERIWNEALRDG